jgi:hypothetical protein
MMATRPDDFEDDPISVYPPDDKPDDYEEPGDDEDGD